MEWRSSGTEPRIEGFGSRESAPFDMAFGLLRMLYS
jgi:hypothetical protein